MKLTNVIDILYEEKESVKEELKKAKAEKKEGCWLTRKINDFLLGDTQDADIWYMERLNRELSEAIKVLEKHERSER